MLLAGRRAADLRRRFGPPLGRSGAGRSRRSRATARAELPRAPGCCANRAGQRQRRSDDSPMISSSTGERERRYREARPVARCSVEDRPHAASPLHGDVRYDRSRADDRTLEAAGRLSTNFNGFNLSTLVSWQRRLGSKDPPQKDLLEVGLDRIGPDRRRARPRRGELGGRPQNRFRSAELSAYWSASDQPIGKARSPMMRAPGAGARAYRISAISMRRGCGLGRSGDRRLRRRRVQSQLFARFRRAAASTSPTSGSPPPARSRRASIATTTTMAAATLASRGRRAR